MIRKREQSIRLAGGFLFCAVAVIFTALPSSARAQGWTTELSDITKNPPPVRKRRGKPAMAAAPKAQTRAGTAKTSAPKATKIEAQKAEPAKPDPAAIPFTAAAEPAKAEPALIPAADSPKPEQTRTEAAAESSQTGAEPAMAENAMPEDKAAEQNDEPDDPFVDLKVIQRPADGEVLTTQVVPGENQTPTEAAPPAERGAVSQYCTNIADAAIDARIAWQRQNLAEAEKEVQKRTAELEVKTAEYQRWLTRRDEFAQKAQKAIIDIYSKMKPDAAALQLQALDDETAAAVLIKLDARVASAVMNEMEPVQAARLTAILSGAAKGPGSRPRQAPPAGNRS
jgi:flagellar motility protein MotE (MotC chaperone)